MIRAVVVNAGNANAATGETGDENVAARRRCGEHLAVSPTKSSWRPQA